jgi:hypothetical protein
MNSRTSVVRIKRERTASDEPVTGTPIYVYGAPIVAVLAGFAAEWLDFRTLRYPILLLVGLGVLATAYAIHGARPNLRAAALIVLLGAATWGAAESLYAAIHVARGNEFDAARFGPQWRQAVGLIAVHAGVLGVPTGIAAAALLHALPFARDRIRPR